MMADVSLRLPDSIMRKLDEHRGDVGRAEFVESCVNGFLANREVPAVGYATREELEEFKRGIRNLQTSFIEFVLTYLIELAR